ncbi:hypothetical protein NBRC10513_002548 [Rhodotorula toruloides]
MIEALPQNEMGGNSSVQGHLREDSNIQDSQTSVTEAVTQAKAWLKEDRNYTYTELLGRFFSLLYQLHPSLSHGAGKKKYTIPRPQLFREGNKRSIFANIADLCKRMHHQPEHVTQFLFAELGMNGSVDGSSRLVIKGRFQQSASTRLVADIKTAFQAATRAARRAARA